MRLEICENLRTSSFNPKFTCSKTKECNGCNSSIFTYQLAIAMITVVSSVQNFILLIKPNSAIERWRWLNVAVAVIFRASATALQFKKVSNPTSTRRHVLQFSLLILPFFAHRLPLVFTSCLFIPVVMSCDGFVQFADILSRHPKTFSQNPCYPDVIHFDWFFNLGDLPQFPHHGYACRIRSPKAKIRIIRPFIFIF